MVARAPSLPPRRGILAPVLGRNHTRKRRQRSVQRLARIATMTRMLLESRLRR
jgi:hypothetical protein